jgi:hypothetical protein
VAERIASVVSQLIFFILTSGVTCILALIIVPTIHESGHAAACIIQGGVVTHWKPLPFGSEADTGCSAGLTPFLCAAGSLASIAAWLVCTYVYRRHATRLGTGRLWNFAAMLWLWWSVWVFGELFMDALHAYSDVPLHHDTGYFVRLTGINPAVASIMNLAVIAILGVPFVRVARQTFATESFGG